MADASFPHRTELVFECDAERDARIVERSVGQEVGQIETGRSRASVSRDAAAVTVVVEAGDLTALRAGQNTWLTLVEVAEEAMAAGAGRR